MDEIAFSPTKFNYAYYIIDMTCDIILCRHANANRYILRHVSQEPIIIF